MSRQLKQFAEILSFVGVAFYFVSSHAAAPTALRAQRAVVATDHPLASQAGIDMIRQGGNSVDAACAAAFALGVVNPSGSGIGGGGFMLVHRQGEPDPVALDFRETAPAAAHATMFEQKGLPDNASQKTGLAVAIPGEVLGCAQAISHWGKLTLKRVLEPAIRLASRGFLVGKHLAGALQKQQQRILQNPGLSADFVKNDAVLKEGQIARRPRLARALRAIATKGPDVFYKGWIAQDLIETTSKHGGIVNRVDFERYKTVTRKPLKLTVHNWGPPYEIHVMPPPSSGGVAMIQSLRVLSAHRRFQTLPHNSSAYVHVLAETLKHVFADRARFLGDTDFVAVPIATLISPELTTQYAGLIGDKTLASDRYGSQKLPVAPPRDSGTSHISVIDSSGVAVALTTTINTSFGSEIVGARSGIILNNQMDDFSTVINAPNAFGLVQGRQNAIAPGKRPLSSMTPLLVIKNGRAVLALGGSGGPTIISATLQVLLNVVHLKLELGDAVARTRFHHQWAPNKLFVEADLPADVTEALRQRGHQIDVQRTPFTAVQAAGVDEDDGTLQGAADPRKHGQPAGY